MSPAERFGFTVWCFFIVLLSVGMIYALYTRPNWNQFEYKPNVVYQCPIKAAK